MSEANICFQSGGGGGSSNLVGLICPLVGIGLTELLKLNPLLGVVQAPRVHIQVHLGQVGHQAQKFIRFFQVEALLAKFNQQ